MRKLLLIAVVILTLVLSVLPGIASAQGLCEYALPGPYVLDELLEEGPPDVRQFGVLIVRQNPQNPNCPLPVSGVVIVYEDIDNSGSLSGRDNILEVYRFHPPH